MILSIFKTLIIAILSLFFTCLIVLYPEVSVESSIKGLTLWWYKVFPSLLPFFILSELMMAFGIVKFIGVLFEPVMRPLFRVPGIGGFVLVMGMISGFPNGAKMTANLYNQGQLTRIEALRLSTFTNFSNPLFIFAVVAYGFFHSPKLGILFAASHYLGNLIVGFIMRFYHGKDNIRTSIDHSDKRKKRLIHKAFLKMHETRITQIRPLGKILGDAVQSSISTLLMVGGFIILFSVISGLLEHIHLLKMLSTLFSPVFNVMHVSPNLTHPFLTGWFEMTIGAENISNAHASLIERVMLTSFLLGFSGFSIQAQVVSLLSEVHLDTRPFLLSRLMHGVFAAILSGIGCMFFPIAKIQDGSHSSTMLVKAFVFENSDSIGLFPRFLFFMTLISLLFYIHWTIFRPAKQQ